MIHANRDTFEAFPPQPRLVVIPPPPVNGINLWLPSAARAMRHSGKSEIQAIEALRAYEPLLRRCYQSREVERAVALVYGTEPQPRQGAFGLRSSVRPFDQAKLVRITARRPRISTEWLKRFSPIDVSDVGPERYLHAITNAGEQVLCFTRYDSQGQHLWRNLGGLCLTNSLLAKWEQGLPEGAWFLPQPVTGEWFCLDRLRSERNPTGRTRRAEEAITTFRFALLESDEAAPEDWLCLLAHLPLPIVSITTSGGKSIHALVLVNAATKDEWNSIVRVKLLPLLTPLGADPAALTAVRLTRLPSVHRGPRLQELLFLDNAPSGQPIADLLPRSEHAHSN